MKYDDLEVFALLFTGLLVLVLAAVVYYCEKRTRKKPMAKPSAHCERFPPWHIHSQRMRR